MKKRHLIYSLPMILLSIVIAAGWFTTESLGNKARQEIVGESQTSVLSLSIHVSGNLSDFNGAVKSMAGSPWIAPALLSKRDQDFEHANSVLDRYNSALNASVSYLMDANGMTVASSNRKDPDSFIGKSYRFRPYFQEAAKGRAGHYFALGITSGKRGFYASYPVQDRLGKVIGVVTMKKDLDEIETFFSNYPFCFLISPDGIVFLSSKPAMVLKSLWPLEKKAQEKLIASQQFGNILSESPYFKKEIVNALEVTLEGKDYLVSRKVINNDGWSIVVLTPTDRIRLYKLIGILATISVCVLIMVFLGIIYFTDRSREAFRQSEESKRLLLHAVGDGILGIDTTGQVTFVNPAALRMLGFSEEEMLGQNAHSLIHHSRKDGSSYPVEDCPMHASCTKAADSHVTDEVFWRKDSSSFPVEYSSTSIIRDGRVMGVVVSFKDITERKHAEEALQESESRMRAITDSAQDAILMMDPEGLISYWNPAAERILGYTSVEAMGQKLHALIVPAHYQEAHHAAFPLFQQSGQGAAVGKTLDLEARRKDGEEISVQLSLSAIQIKGAWHAVGILRDITERKRMEAEIIAFSITDQLTGLHNRRGFLSLAEQQLKLAERNKSGMVLFFADLDGLKWINDTLGHEEGDKALIETATVLKETFRASDIIARLGGDEYSVLTVDITEENSEAFTTRLQSLIDTQNKQENRRYRLSISVGCSYYNPEHPCSLDELIAQADQLMYKQKQSKKNLLLQEASLSSNIQ